MFSCGRVSSHVSDVTGSSAARPTWAAWKTYVGRPEQEGVMTRAARRFALSVLGTGLYEAERYEESLSVAEAELSMLRRLGASERCMLAPQSNLANTYQVLGRLEDALRMRQDVYSGYLKLYGEEHVSTLRALSNYAMTLKNLNRHDEVKLLLRKSIRVAQRILGGNHELTLKIRWAYAVALCNDPSAKLDDHRESLEMLEDLERTARRVLGGAHPITKGIEGELREARAALSAREMS